MGCRYGALNVQAGTQFCDAAFQREVAKGGLSSASLDRFTCVALAGVAAEYVDYGQVQPAQPPTPGPPQRGGPEGANLWFGRTFRLTGLGGLAFSCSACLYWQGLREGSTDRHAPLERSAEFISSAQKHEHFSLRKERRHVPYVMLILCMHDIHGMRRLLRTYGMNPRRAVGQCGLRSTGRVVQAEGGLNDVLQLDSLLRALQVLPQVSHVLHVKGMCVLMTCHELKQTP